MWFYFAIFVTVNEGGEVNIGPTLSLCGSALPPSPPCPIPLPPSLSELQCLAVPSPLWTST